MNDKLTDITVVLDRSGSMYSIKQDMEGGFDQLVEKQQKEKGQALLTLCQFDTEYEIVYQRQALKDVPPLNLVPRGATALLDAIGRTIVSTGERLKEMPEADRPGKVIFVILTDGMENSSHEFSRKQIFDMITHQREAYNWEFIFLGANQDAIEEAGHLGIDANKAMTFAASSAGTQATYDALSEVVAGTRDDDEERAAFSPAQRSAAMRK